MAVVPKIRVKVLPQQKLRLRVTPSIPGRPGDEGPQGPAGLIQSIVAGSGVSVDATDPANPVVSALGAVSSVNGQSGAVVLDADDIDDTATTNKFTTAGQLAKIDHLTVTQPVDLDAIETRVNALDAAVVLKGTWDASGGSFPGSGSAQAGESWIVSVGGIVDSVAFTVGDRIIAITDNASTSTYASNWFKADYTDTDATTSVKGVVELATDAEARARTDTGRTLTPSNLTEIGPAIFLIATGQSNMAAAAALSWTPEANLFLWNNSAVGGGSPVGTAFAAMSTSVMNPAYAWANEIAKANPLSDVYLVVCAEANTTISDWMTGSPSPDMYDYLKDATEAALANVSLSTIDGLLWWQGESDAIAGTTTYYANFNTVVTRFRGETWFSDSTPITIMGLCEGDAGTVANFNQHLVRAAADEPGIRRFVRTYLVGAWNVDNLHMAAGVDYQQAGILAYRGAQTLDQNAYVDPSTRDFIVRYDLDAANRIISRNLQGGTNAHAQIIAESNYGTLTLTAFGNVLPGYAELSWNGAGPIIYNSTNGHQWRTGGVDRIVVSAGGFVSIPSAFGLGAPVTKTADFSVAATENLLINNKTGSACSVTLPTASSFPGRILLFNNEQAQALNSASSNVVPKVGGSAGTAILPATDGAWALVVSDGTNWKIMLSGT